MNGNFRSTNSDAFGHLLQEWNNTNRKFSDGKTIHQLFQEQAKQTPTATAIVYENDRLTYDDLDKKSNQLARQIRQRYFDRKGHDLPPETFVGLLVNKSQEMIVGILAILKAGGTYVPMDSGYPQVRLDHMLEDTKMEFILSQKNLISEIQLRLPLQKIVYIDFSEPLYKDSDQSELKEYTQAENLAYIIYTSGTTGIPKGVMIEHKAAINTIEALYNVYQKGEVNRVAAFSAYVFDVSISEIFSTICQGLELHILPDVLRPNISALTQYFVNNQIDLAFIPPVLLGQFPSPSLTKLKRVIYAGEACSKPAAKAWTQAGVTLFNYYGPTEAAIYAVGKQILDDEAEQIGTPIQNTKAYILDDNLNIVMPGIAGMLYISGAGLARGYLNQQALTSHCFIENPFLKSDDENNYNRLYRTGDLARWCSDGNIEFIGRDDDQVKIRGFRVELKDIENTLLQIDGIMQCCVLMREITANSFIHKQIIAYCVLKSNATLTPDVILSKLYLLLPAYMIPQAIILMGSLPININGKIDKKALPEVKFSSSIVYAAPVTNWEKTLCKIWEEILGIREIGTNDNFFRMGGDSISAVKVCHRVEDALGCKVKPADIFQHNTVSALHTFLISLKDISTGENWEIK